MTLKTVKYIFIGFLAAIALSTSCINKDTKEKSAKVDKNSNQLPPSEMEEPDGIQLLYINPINNYKVHVDWYPQTDARQGAVKGKGIIHFHHPCGTYFSIEHNNFYLSNAVPIKFENNLLILPTQRTINIDYTPYPENDLFIKTDLPFIFYDTNFDGDKEIVLIHRSNNKQTEDSLTVFATNAYINTSSPSHQITDKKPYCNMNSNTEFNRQEKTVTLQYAKNGITEKRIYKRNPKENELQFEMVEGKYKEFVYAFDNFWGEGLADSYLDQFHEEINNGVDLYSTKLMRKVINN